MANRYWVTGGTGNWNDVSNWSATSGGASGASVPGSSDAALLDANSGAGTVTLDISPDIQTLTCTGFTGTLAFGTNTISLNSTGTIFTGATTMTVTGTPQIICTNSSATSRTINATAVTEANSISFRVTAGTGALTFTGSSSFRDLDFTDGVNPTGYAGTLGNSAITIYGNFTASTGMSRTAGTSAYTFAASSGTKTINTAGVTFDCPFTFNGVGGTWQLQAAATLGSTRNCTLTNGTLDLAGYTFTTGRFTSSNANARTISFGAGSITLTADSATIWNSNNSTDLTVTGTPTINATYSGSVGTRTFTGPGAGFSEARAFDVNVTAGTDTVVLGNRLFRNINFTGFAGTITLASTGTWGSLTLPAGLTAIDGAGNLSFFGSASGPVTADFGGNVFSTTGTGPIVDAQDRVVKFTSAFTGTVGITLAAGALQLPAGLTTTVGTFTTSGATQKYLQSTTSGTQATLSQSSGTVSTSYLSIRDINATGGAVWQAYTTNQNVDAGNNDGWDFSPQLGKYIYTRRKNKRILP